MPVEHMPEYWAFHKAMRESGTREHPDHTIAQIMADWMEEADPTDWRATLLRNTANETAIPVNSFNLTHHAGHEATYNPFHDQYTVKHGSPGHTNFFHARDPKTGEARYVAYTSLPHPWADLTGDPVRFWSVLSTEHMDAMARQNPEIGLAKKHADTIGNDGSRPPVKLARSLGDRVRGLWSKLTGGGAGTPQWNHHYDGIVHTGGGLDNYAKPFAERSAVAQALQKISGNAVGSDAERIRRYTELAHRFVKLFPNHQLTKHYVPVAERLNDPATAPGYADLATAVTPLVRFLNRIEAGRGRDEMAVPQLPDRRKPAAPTIREPEEPVEWPLAIRKAADEGSRIPLAGLRRRYSKAPVETPVADDLPPIPLTNYPGETGPTGDRWGDLDDMKKRGVPKAEMVKHLMDRYALSPRNALETLKRWANRKGHDHTKLARPKPVPEPTEKQVQTVAPQDKDWLAGTQLAYHLRSLVNEGITNRDHVMVNLARRALGYRNNSDDPAHGKKGAYRENTPLMNHWWGAPAGTDRGGAYTGPATYKELAGHTTDPFADLGRYLKERKHRLATAYNWHTMERSMMRDRAVEAALRKLIVGARDDHHLFTGVARKFGLGLGRVGPEQEIHNQFWTRLKKMVDASPHTLGPSSLNQLNNSLKRLADREEFRREVGEPRAGTHEHTWQQIFGMLPGSKYMKMQRTE